MPASLAARTTTWLGDEQATGHVAILELRLLPGCLGGAVDRVPEPPALREARHHHDHPRIRQMRNELMQVRQGAAFPLM